LSLQGSNMFDKYFKVFEGNDHRRQRYQLILSSGQVISGIPIAASDATHSGTFSVTLDSGKFIDVEWNRLLSVSPIDRLRAA